MRRGWLWFAVDFGVIDAGGVRAFGNAVVVWAVRCVSGLVLALGLGLLLVLDFVGWFLRYFGRASVVCFGLWFCSAI